MAKTKDNPKTRTCAAMQHHKHLADTDAAYRANRRLLEEDTANARFSTRLSVLRIPVVVHVIYHTDQENLEPEQIESQIVSLNRDFRLQNDDRNVIPQPFQAFATDTLIEFALAARDPEGNPTSGITRTRTSKSAFPYDRFNPDATARLDAMIKYGEFGKAAWPTHSYLNLWACTISGGLLGYAQFPGGPAATDGVVVNNTAFGTGGIAAAPYNLGRTAVHEVGHWLNLLHIWGDDGTACTHSDNVDDTPNQSGSNGSEVRRESFPHVSCNNGPHGDMFMNYMDYVDDDTMIMFTKGQLARMNATLAGPRSALATSQGLTPITTPRLVTTDDSAGHTRADRLMKAAIGDERGNRPKYVFDGVSWISVE